MCISTVLCLGLVLCFELGAIGFYEIGLSIPEGAMGLRNIVEAIAFYQFIFMILFFAGVNLTCKRIKSQVQYLILTLPMLIGTITFIFLQEPELMGVQSCWDYLAPMVRYIPQLVVLALVVVYQLVTIRVERIFVWSRRTAAWVLLLVVLDLTIFATMILIAILTS